MKIFAVISALFLYSLVGCSLLPQGTQHSGEQIATEIPTASVDPTESSMVVEPLPPFIEELNPKPGASVRRVDDKVEICLKPDFSQIVEPGDYLLSEDMYDRMTLFVNGTPWPITDETNYLTLLSVQLDGKDTYFAGDVVYCWAVADEADMFDATIQIQQTSGHILSYSWTYKLK